MSLRQNQEKRKHPEFDMARKGMRFYGRVQGVGFRYRARQAAQRYGLTGLIRSLARIRRDPLFTDSSYKVTASADHILTAVHSRGGDTLAGVFSLKGEAACACLPLPDGVYRNLIDETPVEVSREHVMCDGRPIIVRHSAPSQKD